MNTNKEIDAAFDDARIKYLDRKLNQALALLNIERSIVKGLQDEINKIDDFDAALIEANDKRVKH